jgi:ParE toxin of type II toxin-antitoxin system, parDE
VASDWSVRLTAEAQAGLDELLEQEGEECYNDALQAIWYLVEDLTPAGSVRMRKTRDYYRFYICHERWRVIYRVFFGQLRILVDRVGPRPTVYSGFDRW